MQEVDKSIPEQDPGSKTRVDLAIVRFPQCPICGLEDPRETITDALSLKEFSIAGICQDCQNQIFGVNT